MWHNDIQLSNEVGDSHQTKQIPDQPQGLGTLNPNPKAHLKAHEVRNRSSHRPLSGSGVKRVG